MSRKITLRDEQTLSEYAPRARHRACWRSIAADNHCESAAGRLVDE